MQCLSSDGGGLRRPCRGSLVCCSSHSPPRRDGRRCGRRRPAPVSIEKVAGGLDTPWGIAFLPGGAFLVTERGGSLFHFDAARRRMKVSGVPQVYAWGQGGLMDVAAAQDFPKTREIFLTYSKPYPGGAGTALAVAALSRDNRKLENRRVIFEMAAPSLGLAAFRLQGRGGARRNALSHLGRARETPISRRISRSTTARSSA